MSLPIEPATPSRVKPLLAVLLLAGLAWGGLVVSGVWHLPQTRSAGRPFDPQTWTWRSEEHWVVDQTVQDIVEMLAVAARQQPGDWRVRTEPDTAQPHVYRVHVEGPKGKPILDKPLRIRNFLWDPQDYLELIHGLRADLGVNGETGDGVGAMKVLEALLDPRPLNLERTQQRASGLLNAAPASPEAHEAAAAVLAAFALFEEGGSYQDHRPVLSRLSAHLALAASLRQGETGPAGQVGQVALQTLMGRSTAAMAALEALPRQGEGRVPQAWVNVLAMRTTGDWRIVKDPGPVSLAESLASVATRGKFDEPKGAYAWILPHLGGGTPTFLHHSAFRWSLGVEMGHRATGPALGLDLKEVQEVREARSLAGTVKGLVLTEALNARPTRAWQAGTRTLEVIGWGLWANRFQAALLDDMEQRIVFLADQYGSKREAEAFQDSIARDFHELTLFPLLQRRCARFRLKGVEDATERLDALLRRHPEAISDAGFVCLSREVVAGAPALASPRYNQWLGLPVPLGTAYNLKDRCWEMSEWYHGRYPEHVAFRALRPFDLWLSKDCLLARFPKEDPTPEAVEELYGATKAFAPRVYLDWMSGAYPESSPEHLRILEQLAVMDPEKGYELADRLYDRARGTEGLAAELKAFREDEDRVRASNYMIRAVRELYRLGRVREAEEIAEASSDTGSAMGLQTKAVLRELQGRYADAEAQYEEVEDRYGKDYESARIGFYQRCATRNPGFKRKRDTALARLFPQGVRPYEEGQASMPPLQGVCLGQTPTWAMQQGLAKGAIIVAIDGMVVGNQHQYMALRDVGLDDRLDLVVFQGGRYQSLKVRAPNRRFGVPLVDHSAR